MPGGMLTETLS